MPYLPILGFNGLPALDPSGMHPVAMMVPCPFLNLDYRAGSLQNAGDAVVSFFSARGHFRVTTGGGGEVIRVFLDYYLVPPSRGSASVRVDLSISGCLPNTGTMPPGEEGSFYQAFLTAAVNDPCSSGGGGAAGYADSYADSYAEGEWGDANITLSADLPMFYYRNAIHFILELYCSRGVGDDEGHLISNLGFTGDEVIECHLS